MDDIHQLAKADKLEVGIDYWRMLANRRLELLREMEEFVWDDEQSAYFCQICGANSNHGHLDDCRLAKELSDEA